MGTCQDTRSRHQYSLARSPSHGTLGRDGTGDQRTDRLDHQDQANEVEEEHAARARRSSIGWSGPRLISLYTSGCSTAVCVRRPLGRIDVLTISCVPTVDKVTLQMVTTQGGDEMLEYEPYRVFHLKT